MERLIILALTTLGSAFVGSYLAGYLKKKAENLATHEDIDKLVKQVAAVTTTTKEIEAKITNDVWDRQKRWELKREVLFEATKRVSEIDDALQMFDTVLQVEIEGQNKEDLDFADERIKYQLKWRNAAVAFDETRLFVAVVCGHEAKEAFDALGRVTDVIAAGISKKDQGIYAKSQAELSKTLSSVRATIRKELGIDALGRPPA
jgi:hypothetical protein